MNKRQADGQKDDVLADKAVETSGGCDEKQVKTDITRKSHTRERTQNKIGIDD